METQVREIMSTELVVGSPEDSIASIVLKLQQKGIDALPIVDKLQKVLGMVTKSHILDVLRQGADWNESIDKRYFQEVMCIDGQTNVYDICKMPVKRLPVVDDYGKLVGIITKTDLMKIFAQDVRLVKERLSTIIKASHNGIMAIDQNKTVITCNPAAESALGIKEEEVLDQPVEKFFPEPHLSCLLDVLVSGRSERGLSVFLNGKSLLMNLAPIIRNGEVLGAVAFFQDISELEIVSSQLESFKKLSSKLQSVIGSSFDGICIINKDGEVEEINAAYETLMGADKKKDCLTQKLFQQVEILAKSVTAMDKTPTGRQVLITGNPVFDSNNNLSMIVTNVCDITLLNKLKTELEETRQLKEQYSQELQELRYKKFSPDQIVANSTLMKNVMELAQRVSRVNSTVLLLGETGVGKELLVKFLHENSLREKGPLIKINCAAIPEQLLESELFGYEPGAFTGASRKGKPGQFELARNGTIFLDEIGEMPLMLQAKLLRVLQEQEISKVGGVAPIRINARVITATNKNLEELVKKKMFREDLFYRLNVIPLTIPPLRKRKEDLPSLIFIFLQQYNLQFGMNKKFSSGALDYFMNYSWPGNVRELANVIERLIVTSKGSLLTEDDLPKFMRKEKPIYQYGKIETLKEYEDVHWSEVMSLRDAVGALEKRIINGAISKHGSIRKAAKVLQVDPSTLVRKLDRLRRLDQLNENQSS